MRATIGPYRVIDVVGAGGMGTVYRVAHRATGHVAAAKVLGGATLEGTARERFYNEARIHQALAHPHIVATHEFFELGGEPCLIMEYVDGDTLEARLRAGGPLDPAEAFRVCVALADAVGYLHGRGIVHRDLKASNVKLDTRGGVKLLDFGIATSDASPRLTRTGHVVGTLMALAPEQLGAGRAEPRSDVWALGVLLYELLTGRPPFAADAPGPLLDQILRGAYVPPSRARAGLPRGADRVVGRCLRVRPDERYASAEALLTDLRGLQRELRGETPPGAWRAWRPPEGVQERVQEGARELARSGEVAGAFLRRWRLGASAAAAGVALLLFGWSILSPVAPEPPPAGQDSLDTRRGGVTPVTPSPRDDVGGGIVERAPERAPEGMPEPVSGRVAERVLERVPEPAAGPSRGDARRVTIRVLEGEAEVYRGGVRVGVTPYLVEAPIGAEVSLVLRRRGCDDARLTLRMAEGMDELFESMRRCRAP